MPTSISRAFKDISLSFTRHPVTNDITILKNEDAIKKSVINLCRTSINERFFNPLIGTRIGQSLFELNDLDIAEYLEQDIENTLKNYEHYVVNATKQSNAEVESHIDALSGGGPKFERMQNHIYSKPCYICGKMITSTINMVVVFLFMAKIITKKNLGILIVQNNLKKTSGIITDGQIRRTNETVSYTHLTLPTKRIV